MSVCLEEITRVEDKYRIGQPSLGRALELLRERWRAGSRDEETALRLLFLIWYSVAEPDWLTGLPSDIEPAKEFSAVFTEAGGEDSATATLLLAVAKMAEICPYALGDEEEWLQKAAPLAEKARQVDPQIDAHTFAGRGAAGDYFQHILSAEKVWGQR